MRNTRADKLEEFVPETFWLCFDLTNGDGRLPSSMGYGQLMGTNLGAHKLVRHHPALAAFGKMIESLGGLESIKPGECMKLGTMGDFTINLYRIKGV